MRTTRTTGATTALVASAVGALLLTGCVSGSYVPDYRDDVSYYRGGSVYRSSVYPWYYPYPNYYGYYGHPGYSGYSGHYGPVPYPGPYRYPGRGHDGRDGRDRDHDRNHDRNRDRDHDRDHDRRDRWPQDGRGGQDREQRGPGGRPDRDGQDGTRVQPPERRPPPARAVPAVQAPRSEPVRRPGAAPRLDEQSQSERQRLPD